MLTARLHIQQGIATCRNDLLKHVQCRKRNVPQADTQPNQLSCLHTCELQPAACSRSMTAARSSTDITLHTTELNQVSTVRIVAEYASAVLHVAYGLFSTTLHSL